MMVHRGTQGLLLDTALLVALMCVNDGLRSYAECVVKNAERSGLALYVYPHSVGEALQVVARKIGEGFTCETDVWSIIGKYGLTVKGYSRDGFSTLIYSIWSRCHGGRDATSGADDIYEMARVIQIHGVQDFLLLTAAFADDDVIGIVTPERKLLQAPLIGILADLTGREKPVSPAPHRSLRQCERHLQ